MRSFGRAEKLTHMTRLPAELPHSLKVLFADQPESLQLENGLTVVHQQNLAHPVVSVQVWVKTGSIHEQDHLGSGLSHFLEHMLFKGTGKRGPGQIADEVQAFGGQINAYTAFDRTVYYIDGPSESLESILELLADQTLNASLPKDEVEKEREVILREIDMTLDDPDRIVSRALFSTAFRTSPLQYPVIGYRSLFEQVSRECLQGYYRQRYLPNNMVISIAGNFNKERIAGQVEQAFGQFPRGILKPVIIAEELNQLAFRESRKFGDYKMARGLMAFKVPSMRHEDSPALDVMAAIIGSGYSGKLRQRLREELELVHAISASIWNPAEPGLLFVQFQSDPGKAEAAEAAIMEFFSDICQRGFTQEEVDKARRFALVSEIHSRQTVSGLASRLGLVTAVVGDLHYPQRYFRRIQSITPDVVRDIAQRTFDSSRACVSTLLPESCSNRKSISEGSRELNPFQERILPNGARLYWQVDKHLPRTWLRFAGLGGPLFEDQQHRGVTALMTTLLNRDTEFKSASEVAEDLESRGGFMMDASGNNTFALSLEVMPEDVAGGILALDHALFHPAFLEQSLQRERASQIAHLREMEDDILDFGRLALRRRFFGEHPFASHPHGLPDSVGGIDATAVRGIHQKLLVGSNSILVIAGDFEEQEILPLLEKLMLKIPPGKLDPVACQHQFPATTGHIRERLEREQAVVFQAFPDVGVAPDESLVGEVLDEILSDMSGPLFKAVREEQSLAYYVGASRLLSHDFGCFYLYAGTHPDKTDQVLDCFETELERIRQGGLSTGEIEAAKTRLKVANRFSLQNPAARATRVTLNALYGKAPMAWLDYEERLTAVSADDLVQFAASHLNPDISLRLVVTPN